MTKLMLNFNDFYHQYRHLVFFICYRYLKDRELSQDATSDVFAYLLEQPHQLDGVEDFSKWLPVIVRNRCLKMLDKLRKDKNKFEHYFDYQQNNSISEEIAFSFTYIEEQLLRKKLITDLQEALNNLKYNHQVCIRMHYLEQKSYKEIMETTQFSLRQVDNYIYYGKKRLQKMLLENGWSNDHLRVLFYSQD